MNPNQPKSISILKAEGVLEILWQDDHLSRYPLHGLRKACPCAVCKGGHAHMHTPTNPAVFFEPKPLVPIEIISATPNGTYAIQFQWNDGHNSGLYRWELLRSLCPCKLCKPQFYSE